MRSLLPSTYGIDSVEEVLAEYLRRWKRIAEEGIDLLPGAESTVRKVAGAGALVALVTSGERGYADEFLRISGLAEVFVCAVTLEDVVKLKPNPGPYLKPTEIMGVESSQCVVFEDSVVWFKAARPAGMYSVGVGEVALHAVGDDAPDLAIGSFNDLNPDRLFGARD